MKYRALVPLFALVAPLGISSAALASPAGEVPAVAVPAAAASAAPSAPVALTGPQVGAPAPPFDLTTIDGKRVTLDTFKGKTLVINVWGTWCPPCRQEMPDLLATAPQLMKSGTAFLGVDTTEEAPVVRAFAVAKAVPYPLAIDTGKSFAAAYDIAYFPTTFVIDPQGVLRARYIDVLGRKQLVAMVDAAAQGRNADIVSPLQSKIDATLASVPLDFGSDPQAVEAAAKKADKAIATAEDDLDQSDSASGNSTDLLRTRAEEAVVRDAAIAALVNVGTSIDDKSLLPRLHGDAALDREAWSDALAAYSAALAVDPTNNDALSGTAQAAGRLQKYDVAVDADTKLAALEPAEAGDLVDLARAQAKAGDKSRAATTFAQAIALAEKNAAAHPGKPKPLRLLAYSHLYAGRFEAANGDAAHARVAYEHALAAAERLPTNDLRHDMYVEESQEAEVALGLTGSKIGSSVSLAPWTGADLPGSVPNTIKYRLVVAGAPGHNVSLKANDVPNRWIASFCSDRVCAPFRVSVVIPENGVKVVEFQLVPPGAHTPAPRVRVTGTDGGREFSATT
jgi:peroxiredoxin/Flp pilus assembly protein TadD